MFVPMLGLLFGLLLWSVCYAVVGDADVAIIAFVLTGGVLYGGAWALLRGIRQVFGDADSVLAREREPRE